MALLYPSWIEIPVADMGRALAFYRAVFDLDDSPLYDDEPGMLIAVLLPSAKEFRNPGVSLVQSPQHRPSAGGPQVNFHVGAHAALDAALAAAAAHGGAVLAPVVAMDDGVRYVSVRDSEGNTIALSAYEDPVFSPQLPGAHEDS